MGRLCMELYLEQLKKRYIGASRTTKALILDEFFSNLPFEILGFDCDNGSEFLNQYLIRYFQNRPSAVQFTRSRPYHSGR